MAYRVNTMHVVGAYVRRISSGRTGVVVRTTPEGVAVYADDDGPRWMRGGHNEFRKNREEKCGAQTDDGG